MDDDNKAEETNSHTGWWITAIVLLLIFYVLSPPFLVKVLQACGMSYSEISSAVKTIYAPLILMQEHNFPGFEILSSFYMWCYEWLKIH